MLSNDYDGPYWDINLQKLVVVPQFKNKIKSKQTKNEAAILAFESPAGGVATASSVMAADPSTMTPQPSPATPLKHNNTLQN